MRSIVLAAPVLLAFMIPAARAAAPVAEEAAFFCYWVDGAHKQAATTGMFRAQIAQADAISSQFAKDMRSGVKAKGRVYDCGWRRSPVQAEQDRDSLRAAHAAKGFTVTDLDWIPSSER
jgi:hypothetical protein